GKPDLHDRGIVVGHCGKNDATFSRLYGRTSLHRCYYGRAMDTHFIQIKPDAGTDYTTNILHPIGRTQQFQFQNVSGTLGIGHPQSDLAPGSRINVRVTSVLLAGQNPISYAQVLNGNTPRFGGNSGSGHKTGTD